MTIVTEDGRHFTKYEFGRKIWVELGTGDLYCEVGDKLIPTRDFNIIDVGDGEDFKMHQCGDCGARAENVMDIIHYDTCEPGYE